MAETEIKVIEGRQSALYNHFEEYELKSCRATDTRLMGVVAIKNIWQSSEDPKQRYYQIIHLDYSEYGIDEYLEFECIPARDDYAETKENMNHYWQHFVNVMGGDIVEISAECMLRLIDTALPLASDDFKREYDNEDNRFFRKHALMRLGMMREALDKRSITGDKCSGYDAIDAASVRNIGQYATINYFIMRLIDRDFSAASYLSVMTESELATSPLVRPETQSLIKASIKKHSKKDNPKAADKLRMYNCNITTLGRDGYYYTSLSIWLTGKIASRDALVADMKVGSSVLLSDYESALQVAESEFITVFSCSEDMPGNFSPSYISPLSKADPTICENGILFTIYNATNSHVEKSEYRIGDDVYGYALLSTGGEFVLMSHDMNRISMLDEAMIFSMYSPFIKVVGRYRLDSPIFHSLCHTPGLRFEDMVEPEGE